MTQCSEKCWNRVGAGGSSVKRFKRGNNWIFYWIYLGYVATTSPPSSKNSNKFGFLLQLLHSFSHSKICRIERLQCASLTLTTGQSGAPSPNGALPLALPLNANPPPTIDTPTLAINIHPPISFPRQPLFECQSLLVWRDRDRTGCRG